MAVLLSIISWEFKSGYSVLCCPVRPLKGTNTVSLLRPLEEINVIRLIETSGRNEGNKVN
jgi:hypothetical protein